MTIFDQHTIEAMPQRFRVNFINSLSGFKSANLIGTVSETGQTNLAIISSAFHLGADPALMGFINRPHSAERHTLENLLQTGYYTLNHVNSDILNAAHQTSARYPREQSEFEATNLTEEWYEGINAPFVAQSRVHVGLKYQEHLTLSNKTVLVIGEIIHVKIQENCVREDGLIDIDTTDSVAVSGLDSYHKPNKIRRLSYEKPNTAPQVLEE